MVLERLPKEVSGGGERKEDLKLSLIRHRVTRAH